MDDEAFRKTWFLAGSILASAFEVTPEYLKMQKRVAASIRSLERNMPGPRRPRIDKKLRRKREALLRKFKRAARRRKARKRTKRMWLGRGRAHWITARPAAGMCRLTVPEFRKHLSPKLVAEGLNWYDRTEVRELKKRLLRERAEVRRTEEECPAVRWLQDLQGTEEGPTVLGLQGPEEGPTAFWAQDPEEDPTVLGLRDRPGVRRLRRTR